MPENMLIGLDSAKDRAFLWGATPALASPASCRSAGQKHCWSQPGGTGTPFHLRPAGLEQETITCSPCPLTLGSSYGNPLVMSCSLFTLIPAKFFSL